MATIYFGFDVSSIEKAIKQVEQFQKDIPTIIVPKFIELCLEEIKRLANQNLDSSGIGSNVIAKIKRQWKLSEGITTKGTLINEDIDGMGENPAVFVEFGVGVEGQGTYNTEYSPSNYEYNVQSRYKRDDGHWSFSIGDIGDIDLKVGYFEEKESSKGIPYISTKGQPAVMFLHNAVFEFLSTKAYNNFWQTALEFYEKNHLTRV